MPAIRTALALGFAALVAPRGVVAAEADVAAAMVALTTVEAVRLSPDGAQVAWIAGRAAQAGAHEVRELFVQPADRAAPSRALATTAQSIAEIRWLRDSRALVALVQTAATPSVRELWRIDAATGATTRLAGPLAGASALEVSPDGKTLSFVWRGPPVAKKDSASGPLVLGRPAAPARLWLCDANGENLRALTPPTLAVGKYAWAPDSAALVAATTPADAFLSPRDEIAVVSVAGGAVRPLFAAHDQTISLAWSPDGATIAWCGREHTPGSSQFTLVAAKGGAPRAVLADFPGTAEWLGFRPDGRIAFLALMSLRLGFYSLAADGTDLRTEHAPESAAPGTLGCGGFGNLALSFDATGARVATTISGVAEPCNVVAGPWGGTLTRLTDLNPHVRALPLGAVEDVSWRAADGLRLDGLLVKPPGFVPGKKYPLLTEVHGGPRRAWWACCLLTDETWAQMLASRGYLVFLPNPRGSEGRGAEFVRANTRDFGGGDWRDIEAGVDHLIAAGLADPARLGLCGWSYGGFMTAWGVTQTARYRAAVVGAGITNWTSREGQVSFAGMWPRLHWGDALALWREPQAFVERSPIHHVQRVRTPVLLLHGDADNKVPPGQAIEFYHGLRALGVPVEACLYPGEGHVFARADHQLDALRRITAWFERWIPVSESPTATASSRP